MENPTLRVNKHSGSTSRTFIVEDSTEDEFGQWATDEVTVEQGYIDDERSCFWTWDHNEYAWQSRPFKGRRVKGRIGKGKGKGKVRFQGPEEHTLAKNNHTILIGGHKRTSLGGPKERKVRKASQGNDGFRKVAFALTSQIEAQARISPGIKAEERTKEEKARKELVLNLDF